MTSSEPTPALPVRILPLVDEGLGNSAYLLDLGDGRGLAMDASRDLRALHATADQRGLKVAFAADTHLHADFLSGSLGLAASDGATVLASAAGGREFAHRALADGDEVDLGGLTLRTLATPGHTHEHIAFEVLDGANTVGVFTGGSLLVGSAARTDLVSPELTEELARAQYRSLQRLAGLDDRVAVWPTHGAGSFCSAPPGAQRTSSIGTERATNQLLRAPSEDAFVQALLGSLGTYPPYFSRLGEVNRLGPPLVDGDSLNPLEPGQVRALASAGSPVVDVRALEAFSRAHVPGAVSIPLRDAFATWLGWLITPGTPLVVVRDADQDPAEIVWQARKVGYDLFAGELTDGMTSWSAAGLPTASIPLVAADALDGATVLDIRQSGEFTSGHVPGAAHVELGTLTGHPLPTLPAGPLVVMCGHGERAMSAASLLARAGRREVAVLAGGPGDWAATTSRTLETGR
ncbi:Glyoxylase, beta-lactamase superfamily II [Pedococcus dokdonensis]|uniref:Glyoxylase, beta-lactamase superfamily II n=1 Tax=Pedococcus dokdonensis TaxID=443156 RepID=A0A1H0UAB3_9MICO|nr:MBL fold metallo-hydrolase [Pedococcus dokdonensis]SDP63124.1 Glyoxylase, beta-lactamase superfamily II [Pedococcus dokdonensis]